MDIVKKNWLSITFGVIALVAFVVAFFYPLDGMIEELNGEVKKRVAVQSSINSLMNKRRVVPIFDPGRTEQAKLTQFPSRDTIKKAEDALKVVQSDSLRSYEAALKLNGKGHELVVPGSLPQPINQSLEIEFRNMLDEALRKLRDDELVSGIPPTEEEKKKRADAAWKEISKKIIIVGGEEKNRKDIDKEFEQYLLALPGQMQREMAEKKKIYVNPSKVLKVPAYVPDGGKSSDPVTMWWAQVYYWVASDVVATIKQFNDTSANVMKSPVKNLLELVVDDHFFPGNVAGGPNNPNANLAATGGQPDSKVAITEDATLSPTKRVSNNLYDVVHFTVALDIEADMIPAFLKSLTTDRLISVIRFETFPVDPQLKQIEEYVYGDKPVMTVIIDCEMLLLRDWTLKWMPHNLQRDLGIIEGAPTSGNPGRTR
jgi:hypothetical protein